MLKTKQFLCLPSVKTLYFLFKKKDFKTSQDFPFFKSINWLFLNI